MKAAHPSLVLSLDPATTSWNEHEVISETFCSGTIPCMVVYCSSSMESAQSVLAVLAGPPSSYHATLNDTVTMAEPNGGMQ